MTTKTTTPAIDPATGDEIITVREFAVREGYKPNYGHELAKAGRLVMAPDGKNCLARASHERFNASKDPSKQGVADRHASARAAASDDDGADDDREGARPYRPPQGPAEAAVGNSYQQARAVKEKFLALEAKRAYEVAIGQLRESREVEGLAATAMTELRIRLENLATTMAPMLINQPDESRVRAMLQDQFAHALESASHHFARLAAGHKA